MNEGVDGCKGGLGPLDVHHEVVHLPAGFDSVLADEGGELRIVPDAVQQRVKEDGLARGARGTHGAGDEIDAFVPIDAGGELLAHEGGGALVGGASLDAADFEGIVRALMRSGNQPAG